MKRERIRIIQATCRRCGQPVATASRSVFGLDSLKAQYDRICSQCMTEGERHELLNTIGKAIVTP